jgi:hypothetical protein
MLRPGRRGRWHTRKPPKHWEVGDRLFFWKGAPKLETVGIGEIVDIGPRGTRSLDTDFRVRYLSSVLGRPIGIEILRTDATMRSASFLKSGPSGVLFRLSQKQGERLFRLVCQGNPSIRRYWRPRKVEASGQTRFSPARISRSEHLFEGAPAEVRLNKHERNWRARRACLQHYEFRSHRCLWNSSGRPSE